MSLKPLDVVNELNQLSADQIATRFEDLGIKGIPHEECECPVARYLELIFDTGAVIVSGDSVTVWDDSDTEVWDEGIRIETNDSSIEQFVIRFDNMHYEGLIDDSSNQA